MDEVGICGLPPSADIHDVGEQPLSGNAGIVCPTCKASFLTYPDFTAHIGSPTCANEIMVNEEESTEAFPVVESQAISELQAAHSLTRDVFMTALEAFEDATCDAGNPDYHISKKRALAVYLEQLFCHPETDHLQREEIARLRASEDFQYKEIAQLRKAASILITNAELIDDPRNDGATERDCYAVALNDLESLRAALNPIQESGK